MNDTRWRMKLRAYMHDNPDKATDVRGHKEKAFAHALTDQFQEEEFFLNEADFAAAAADRLLFPTGREHYVAFDGRSNPFRHPLDGGCTFEFDTPLPPDYAHEIAQQTKPVLEASDPRADFICRWRFWRQWASGNDERMAYLPADTRIPDHSIWNHLSITSALQACLGNAQQEDIGQNPLASVLWFSIGPVQPLIAAARSIRDLWSGSYLLSYLTGKACSVIARDIGPDHLISPSGWGQPLIDLHLRDIYRSATVQLGENPTPIWSEIMNPEDASSRQRFLIPSLPNRIMALIPTEQVPSLARRMEDAVRKLLADIGESVLNLLEGRDEVNRDRFASQIAQALEIQWHALPVQPDPQRFQDEAAAFLPGDPESNPSLVAKTLRALDDALGGRKPQYKEQSFRQWQTIYSYSTACLDAVKALRNFEAWDAASQWTYGTRVAKDSLTGKEEGILGPFENEAIAESLGRTVANNPYLFKPGEILGALTLVKRLWHVSWLQNEDHGFQPSDFNMPNTRSLALGEAYKNDAEGGEGNADEETYYAVLAIDGDEMGRWLSGDKMPPLRDQLAPKIREFFANTSVEAWLNDPDSDKALRRPLNPSFHLQFSEALGNFSQFAVRPIVEHFGGRLIYAGGDDVLALLPAHSVLGCAKSLRAAFRGQPGELAQIRTRYRITGQHAAEEIPEKLRKYVFDPLANRTGFLRLAPDASPPPGVPKQPFIVPGPRADISAGIAIGHIKAPIQDLVRAAQDAEKRAKQQYNRSAVAVSLQKRSGEEVHWGSNWEAAAEACGPFQFLESLLTTEVPPSHGFSYKFTRMLTPYLSTAAQVPGIAKPRPADPKFEGHLPGILAHEFEHCLRQDDHLGKTSAETTRDNLLKQFRDYLGTLAASKDRDETRPQTDRILQSIINLFSVYAWINRQSDQK